MNKKVMAIGVAVAVLGGLPVVRALAAIDVGSSTDTIQVVIEPGCTFIKTEEGDAGKENYVVLGQGGVVTDIEGATFDVTCTGRDFEGTWSITAQGDSNAELSNGSGGSIVSLNGKLTGEASNWAFKMNVTGAAQTVGEYGQYAGVPNSPVEVAKNLGDTASGDATIQAYYGVSASSDQAEGTYSGKVIYTLTNTGS